jgi:hypothetical protein
VVTLPSVGSSLAVTSTVNTAGDVSEVLFAGVAGERISYQPTSSSIGSGGYVTLLGPDGLPTSPTDNAGFSSNGGTFLPPQTLSQSGDYALVFAPSSAGTGTASGLLYNVPADLSATVTASAAGTAVTQNVITPGQAVVLNFSGTQGQRVSLQTCPSSSGTCNNSLADELSIGIASASGVTEYSSYIEPPVDDTDFSGALTLYQAGTNTYSVRVAPYPNSTQAQTGSLTLSLWLVPPDLTGTISANGTATGQLATTVPGQLINYSYTNTQTAVVALSTSMTLSYGGYCGSSVAFGLTGAAPIYSDLICAGYDLSSRQTISQTGTYHVTLLPENGQYSEDSALMNAQLTLYNIVDVHGVVLDNASPNMFATNTPEQEVLATLSNTSTTSVIAIQTQFNTQGFYPCDSVTLFSPSQNGTQTQLYSAGACFPSNSFYSNNITLTTAGTYTIQLSPGDGGVSNQTLTIYPVTTASGALHTGSALTLNGTKPAENFLGTFVPTSTQTLTLLSQTSFSGFNVTITDSSGHQLYTSTPSSNSDTSPSETFSAGTTYNILLEPTSPVSGSATFTLNAVGPQVAHGLVANAGSPTKTIAADGSSTVTFNGLAGERVALLLDTADIQTDVNSHCFSVSILAPDGQTSVYNEPERCGADFSGVLSNGSILSAGLPSSGSYTVTYRSLDDVPYRPRFTLYEVPPDVVTSGSATGPQAPSVTTVPGQAIRATFQVTGDESMRVALQRHFVEPDNQCAKLSIFDPSDELVLGQLVCDRNFSLAAKEFHKRGKYTAVVQPVGTSIGAYDLRVTN